MGMRDLDIEIEIAKDTFAAYGTSKDFHAMARIDHANEAILAIIEPEGIAKWEAIAQLAKIHGAHRVVFMADTWMREMGKEDSVKSAQFRESPMRVSEYADRFEAFVVSVIERNEVVTHCYRYEREGGRIVWDDKNMIPEGAVVESLGVSLVRTELKEAP
jgi:hypothetical protein